MEFNDERYINESLARVERARVIADEILSQCYLYLTEYDEKILLTIGILLGDFANNLRSALNYCSRTLLKEQLKPILEDSQFKKISRKLDFPWSTDEEKFEKFPLIKELKKHSGDLYQAYKGFQPFYAGNEWLEHLMILSNKDKHEIVNEVISPTATSFAGLMPDGSQFQVPHFIQDNLIVFTYEGPKRAKLPFYYPPLGAFANSDHTWRVFMVPIKEKFSLDLVTYIRDTPIYVIRILSLMEQWFGTFFKTIDQKIDK